MNQKKAYIIETATHLFFDYGIQHITMDEIASKSGVSKRTIYKYFENKPDLIHQIIELKFSELKKDIEQIQLTSENAIDELHHFFNCILKLITAFSATLYRDLKKNNISITLKYNKAKNSILWPFIVSNINRGQCENLYKDDIQHTNEVLETFSSTIETIVREIFYEEPTSKEKTFNFFKNLFIHRLVNVQGLQYYNRYETIE